MFVKVENPNMIEEIKRGKEIKKDSDKIENIEQLLEPITSDISEITLDDEHNYAIKVSPLISKYLKDENSFDKYTRSKAGYSLRYDKVRRMYTIGNMQINFNNNKIIFGDIEIEATDGLMQLLTKIKPDEKNITEDDIKNYGNILKASNAIWQKFDPKSRMLNADPSKKWEMIKEYYPELFENTKLGIVLRKNKENVKTSDEETKTEDKIILLPDDVTSLSKMLRLSVMSYKAGNTNEQKRINLVLNELKRRKVITLKEYKKIYKNVFQKMVD